MNLLSKLIVGDFGGVEESTSKAWDTSGDDTHLHKVLLLACMLDITHTHFLLDHQ